MGIADDEPFPKRRDPDDTVIPIVMLEVEKRLAETRHALRQEIAVVSAHVASAQAQASKEHTEVRADIRELRRDVTDLKPVTEDLRAQVLALHETGLVDAAHDQTLADIRKTMWKVFGALVAFIGAMTAVLALLAPH
jgi:seryl-tRNA synthetase